MQWEGRPGARPRREEEHLTLGGLQPRRELCARAGACIAVGGALQKGSRSGRREGERRRWAEHLEGGTST